MQLSCEQEQLTTALNAVLPAVKSGPPGVLLDADDHLNVRAADREMSIQYRVRAQVVEEGQVMLLGGVATDLVNLFPEEQVVMRLDNHSNDGDDEDGSSGHNERHDVALQCARHQAHVRAWRPNTIITLPPGDTPIARMEAEGLRDAIRRVAYAAAADSAHRLSAVEMAFSEEHVTLAAADGYRLARYRAPLVEQITEEPEVFAVPIRGVKVLRDLLGEGEVSIALDANRRNVIFQTADAVFTIRLGDKLPNYETIIPDDEDWNVRVVVEKGTLRQACRTAEALAAQDALVIEIVSDGEIVVSASSAETGKGRMALEGKVATRNMEEDARIKLMLNIAYLSDAVRTMNTGDEVVLYTRADTGVTDDAGYYPVNRPLAVRPVGVDKETQIAVAMPMMTAR